MKRPDAYRVYLFLSFTSFALFAALFPLPFYETVTAGLDPLQLMLVGAVLELSVLLCEVPTGILADVYSRRLSIILGHGLVGLGLIVEGLFPSFVPILLAQVVWGVGYTFTSGATQAWLSDEIGEERANRALLTANRYGMAGALVGVLAATALGSFTSVSAPILVGGAGRVLLAILLIFLMSERGFKPNRPENGKALQLMAHTFRKGARTIRPRPALVAILGVGLFYGMTEGFDRLWVRHLLDRFNLPVIFGNNQLAFFGVLEVAGLLISIAVTRRMEKRFDISQPHLIGRLMLGITAGIAVFFAACAWSPVLWLTLGLYLPLFTLRELVTPLMAAWMNQRIDSDVRATVLSMTGQMEAIGQVTGGPAIGLLAKAFSVPLALSLCGGLLAPALGFIVRANHAQPAPETQPAPEVG